MPELGDTVIWHTGFYSGERGQFNRSCRSQDKTGKVIVIARHMSFSYQYLVDFEDGERAWVPEKELDVIHQYSP